MTLHNYQLALYPCLARHITPCLANTLASHPYSFPHSVTRTRWRHKHLRSSSFVSSYRYGLISKQHSMSSFVHSLMNLSTWPNNPKAFKLQSLLPATTSFLVSIIVQNSFLVWLPPLKWRTLIENYFVCIPPVSLTSHSN